MKIEVDVSEEAVTEVIVKKLADDILRSVWSMESRECKRIFADVANKVLYDPTVKNKMINDVVNKAAAEITRKAMPKLIEKVIKK